MEFIRALPLTCLNFFFKRCSKLKPDTQKNKYPTLVNIYTITNCMHGLLHGLL